MKILESKEKRLNRLGMRYLTHGKLEKALKNFQKLILLNSSEENLFNLGVTLMGLFRYEEAEIYLHKQYIKLPNHDINSLSLAECLLMQRKWDESKKIFREIADRNPEDMKEYLEITEDVVLREKFVKSREYFAEAINLLKQKEDLKALELLLIAEAHNPTNANILNNIGSVYMLLKDYEKAHNYFEKAVSFATDKEKFAKNLNLAKRKLKK